MASVNTDDSGRSSSGEWQELRGRVRRRAVEALDLITILLQDAVILLAGFLAEFAYEHWLRSSHPLFQLAVNLSSGLFLLLYGITVTVHVAEYLGDRFGSKAPASSPIVRYALWTLAACGVIAVALVATVPNLRESLPLPAVTRAFIGVAPAERLEALPFEQGHLARIAMALSPDGRTVVFGAARASAAVCGGCPPPVECPNL